MVWKTVRRSVQQPRLHRRRLISGVGATWLGVGAAMLVGCDRSSSDGERTAAGASGTPASITPAVQAKPGGILRARSGFDIDTFGPLTAKSSGTNVIEAYTYSRLLKFRTGQDIFADGTVVPDAVARWEQPDDMTLVLHLRDGVLFDQRPPTNSRGVVADDVVLSWEKIAAESTYKADLANSASKDAPIVSLTATDPRTVEVKTAFVDAQLLPVLASSLDLWVLPKEAFTGGFDPATTMRGSGAWTLKRYQPSVGFGFRKNPNYCDAPQLPLMDGVDLPIITDAAQAGAQFRATNAIWGEYGAEVIPASDVLAFHRDIKDTRIDLGSPSAGGPTLSFSWRENSPYRDVRVRRAISMLIDRDTLIEVFNDVSSFQAANVPMRSYWNTPIGAGYGPYWLDPKSDAFGRNAAYLKQDVAEAKKLLAAAGYPDGFDTPFTFVAGTRYGADWGQRAEALMAMLTEGGIRCAAYAVDYSAVWIPQYLREQGNFDGLAMYPDGPRADPGQWVQVFLSSAGANSQVKNFPALDALIVRQRQEFDVASRHRKFHEIQRFCAEMMPTVPQSGDTEMPLLTLNGLHGPGEYYQWAAAAELLPYFWLDDTLRT